LLKWWPRDTRKTYTPGRREYDRCSSTQRYKYCSGSGRCHGVKLWKGIIKVRHCLRIAANNIFIPPLRMLHASLAMHKEWDAQLSDFSLWSPRTGPPPLSFSFLSHLSWQPPSSCILVHGARQPAEQMAHATSETEPEARKRSGETDSNWEMCLVIGRRIYKTP
jgi:hypothetical protein